MEHNYNDPIDQNYTHQTNVHCIMMDVQTCMCNVFTVEPRYSKRDLIIKVVSSVSYTLY